MNRELESLERENTTIDDIDISLRLTSFNIGENIDKCYFHNSS